MSGPAPRRQAALLGHPVGHSISPRFQQAAFDALGIDAHYRAWDTPAEELVTRIGRVRQPDFLGVNVTIPHKQAVLELVDDASAEVALTGAANTLVNAGGKLQAYNTDVGGFGRALADELGFDARGKAVAVLGAGGAGRAVLVALAQAGADRLVLLNRTFPRAESLAQELGPRISTPVAAFPLDDRARERLLGCDLVVNCTSLGLEGSIHAGESPLPGSALPDGAVVVDIVANPLVTAFLHEAGEWGHRVLGGLPMLVYQGALSFELWTGRRAPVDVMMHAARAAMGGDAAPNDGREARR